MSMRVTIRDARATNEFGQLQPVGSTITVGDSYGKDLVFQGFATDTDGVLATVAYPLGQVITATGTSGQINLGDRSQFKWTFTNPTGTFSRCYIQVENYADSTPLTYISYPTSEGQLWMKPTGVFSIQYRIISVDGTGSVTVNLGAP